ncbi:helix-turn-helix domain-containing protein [Paenibacillus beijingensis]|uniref:AraC family transcriptional regulator n=1 Tax=Paenibacillus beijingensis TaxID=1126833 RepID=A0A0D5NEU8_9BACL|nr:helix-turn-helix domain-containing protein [Paenibacillus beijingensis]AJY73914.1 hypothetical protein VN24_03925 [Paenibacillus beijingensis]
MYNMLIVDDEKFAVEGIRKCNDWQMHGIDTVDVAYNADDARKIMLEKRIDILICDIEMPDEEGFSLVQWVNDRSPHTEWVFLSCHDEFAYAKRALHLGSFDYLLKPVDSEELAQVVGRMIHAIEEKEKQSRYNEMYQKYYSLWKKQQPLLAERFWQDLLSRRILPFGDFLERALKDAQIQLSPEDYVLPFLISIEDWKKPLQEREKEMMEYAVKKAAEELLLADHPGQAIIDKNGILFVIVYGSRTIQGASSTDRWVQAGRQFLEVCQNYFYCKASCYVGYFATFQDLPRLCLGLKEMERNNVAKSQSVLVFTAFEEKETDGLVRKSIQYMKENVEEDISREDVAAHVRLNPTYLSRLFKKETGNNLIDYLIEIKMDRAKLLLDSTDMTVSAIAQQVGYCNFSHFTRMFKKHCGVNPQQYRKQYARLSYR